MQTTDQAERRALDAAIDRANSANQPPPQSGALPDHIAGWCATALISWCATALIIVAIAALLGIVGPTLDDHSAERAQADDLQAAQHQAQAAQRFARAAQELCGREAAAWALLPDGSIQCRTKRGAKTITARVTP